MLELRRVIFGHFDEHKTIEKRLKKYLLMSDDTGLQATLYLLLKLSDDELKGVMTSVNAAARAISMQ